MDETTARPDCTVADLSRHLDGDLRKSLISRNQSDGELFSERKFEQAKFLKSPGGFRRHHLIKNAHGQKVPSVWTTPLLQHLTDGFTGTYLERTVSVANELGEHGLPQEAGKLDQTQAFLAIVKSFIGVAFTVLPFTFRQGGWLFSMVVLAVNAILDLCCIRMLIQCNHATGLMHYDEIAYAAAGRPAKFAVQFSLVLSQFACVVAYFIFVTKVVGTTFAISAYLMTGIEFVALLPMFLLRSLKALIIPISLSNAFILFGIVAMLVYNAAHLIRVGMAARVEAFKPQTCGVAIGQAIFAFEGIPLMLPIKESMREPEKLMPLLISVFSFLVVVGIGFALLGYFSYGEDTEPVAFNHLPAGDITSDAVKVAYSVAVIFTGPLMFLPGTRIVESWIFEKDFHGARKWSKNALRTVETIIFAMLALYGGKVFGNVLAICGATCSGPLALIYPAWFHLNLCARSKLAKACDIAMIIVGTCASSFAVFQALTN